MLDIDLNQNLTVPVSIDLNLIQRMPLSCDKKLLACIDYIKDCFSLSNVIFFMVIAFLLGVFIGWSLWKKK